AFTVETWYKADTWPTNTDLVNRRRSSDNVGGFTLECGTDGKFVWYVHTDTWHATTSPTALSTGVWHHIVGVYTAGGGGSTLLMIDGVDNGRSTAVGSIATPVSPQFQLGSNISGAQKADGQLDEVALYNSAIADAVI